MSNLKEIRTRITSVKSTRQITSAMKMVAAAKLRKTQDRITSLRPYAEKMQEILGHLGENLREDEDNKLVQESNAHAALIVLISSNRGLCGSFNANATKKALAHVQENYNTIDTDFFCIGKKGADILKKQPYRIIEMEEEIFDNPGFDNCSAIAEKLISYFLKGRYQRIEIVYNQFKNAASQKPVVERFLPLKVDTEEQVPSDYIFEPDQLSIARELVPKNLKTQLYKAVTDSYASENGARMTAMQQATDNATDLIKELTLQYNKARQASITNEILEIVSGANALE